MLFNSFSFLAFLLIVIAVSRSIAGWTLRKAFLLLVSYLFYAVWNPPLVLLLWFSTAADWFLARWIFKTESPAARRMILWLSIVVNLGMLSFFKYGDFLLVNFSRLLSYAGVDFHPVDPGIILPIGISFYTFQTMSYVLDIYFRKIKPSASFLDYALYVTFFPQLVAGPIVRAGEFLPQCAEPRKAAANQLGWGGVLLVIGLFQKTVIADSFMAPVAQQVYDFHNMPTLAAAWAGTLAFSIQIFCDFAGYSTCAIGIALMLGFHLPVNFRYPYAAVGIADYWRRWHVTLSTWFRDYLYIPLGGSKNGRFRTAVNAMAVMLLAGLWHGAAWRFVVWGGIHGLLLAGEGVLKKSKMSAWPLFRTEAARFLLALLTFAAVNIAFVIFRAENLSRAFMMIKGLAGLGISYTPVIWHKPWGTFALLVTFSITAAVFLFHWAMRNHSLEDLAEKIPRPCAMLAMSFMIYCVLTSLTGNDYAFIYFQF